MQHLKVPYFFDQAGNTLDESSENTRQVVVDYKNLLPTYVWGMFKQANPRMLQKS